ncbi:MAG: chemotaxis protein CheD [Thermodesulfobacteriota bacterium]
MVKNIIVGISDMKITADPQVNLITYALGSCLGVTLYDPVTKVGGLLHFMLPESRIDPLKAKKCPWMFADTALPLFFEEFYKLGGVRERMKVKVAGGSKILDDSEFFSIGKRNYLTLRKILQLNNVPLNGEDIGGQGNRTMTLEISTGKVFVKISGNGVRVL